MPKHPTDEIDEQSVIYSFVVRIWLEETKAETQRLLWHGHITDVSSGERRYIQSLHEIPEFIQTRLTPNSGGGRDHS